jgi:hypothetical protein
VWEAPTQLRSSPHSDAENERLGGEAEAEEYLEQEDELIQSHRKEIEVSMKAVRQEMALLGRVRADPVICSWQSVLDLAIA